MEVAFVLLLVVTTVCGCGVPSYQPNTGHVVNGEEARPYSWPWQVSLESFFPTCGGTLIASDWVLTAAHCITFHTYRVVLAEHDMNKEEGPEQFIMVKEMFIHPKWNDNCVSCGNDIALLKLEKSAVINDKVEPACLQPALLRHRLGSSLLWRSPGNHTTTGPTSCSGSQYQQSKRVVGQLSEDNNGLCRRREQVSMPW
ncbi:chymotrypsin-like elastase family member 3B [Toxotes jaculatrix]|uniref:chymotrypsin-like elastase family member 3B n=1 Tax=Toxotes jaculatrix TaxID=941984 RepID=UPI001B3B07E3|nr:chymotrypsin-like elastase family member 3B [Toxotes jaculatrix]